MVNSSNNNSDTKVSILTKLGYIFSAREKLEIFLLLIAVIIGTFLELAGVAIFSPFTEVITDQERIFANPYTSFLYEKFHFQDTSSFISFLAGVIIAVYFAKNIYLAFEKRYFYQYSYRNQMRIADRLMDAYMHEDYTFHLNRNVADLQRTLQSDTDLFTKGVIHSLELIAELVTCLSLGVYVFSVSRSIAISVLVLLLVCTLLFTTISRRFSRTIGARNQQYRGKLLQWLNQAIGGIKEVKILGREEYFQNSYHDYFARFVHGELINRMIAITPRYVVETFCMTGLLGAIIVKINYGQKDFADFIPQLAVFGVAAFRLLPSAGKINEHVADILYSAPSLDLIYRDLKDVEDYRKKTRQEQEAVCKLNRGIFVKDVCYHYPNSELQVLNGATVTILKGQSAAFIGSSGAGKTTLADIILGLLTPQYGHVYVDDFDVFRNTRSWQKEIGYIPQSIYLSDDTIRNNIAFGIPDDKISDEKVIEALRKAQLYDYVQGLPDGLDTMVGDRGIRLSGGQRQRIGIARALYHDPEFLVLDEATSALDSETETAVMQAIDLLHGRKTMLIIAHRLSTIRNVDHIYEIGGGSIREVSKESLFSRETS